MTIEELDLEEAKKIIIEWAKGKPFITKVYLFGSRISGFSKKTGKLVRPDSDLDVAIEFEPFPNEDRLTTWVGEGEKWQKELLELLGFKKAEHLDLESYRPTETPRVEQYLRDGSITIYSRVMAMDQNEIGNWIRHYDTLLWTVTAIMVTAIGGLLVYSLEHFNILLAIFGFVLNCISVIFSVSFRERRHRFQQLNPEIHKIISGKDNKIIQWRWYFLVFIILGLFWIQLISKKIINRGLLILWLITSFIIMIMIIYLVRYSGGRKTALGKKIFDLLS